MSIRLLIIFFIVSTASFAQTDFFSVPAGGNWNDGATWGNASPGVEGIDWPGTGDNAFIIGDGAGGGQVNINGNYTAANVIIAFDNSRVLEHTGFSTRTLTVEGQMVGYNFIADDFASPTTTIVENTSRLQIVFTGTQLPGATDPVVFSWSYLATLNNLTLNPPSISTTLHIEGVNINGGTLRVQNGTLQLDNGFEIRDASGGSTLLVDAGNTLVLRGSVTGDGSVASQFSTVTINGSANVVGPDNYLNSTTFTLGAGADLSIGFSNATNQTEGWWYQGARPNTFSIDASSLVNFNSTNNQNIFARQYGDLTIADGGSGATKQVVGTGILSMLGNGLIDGSTNFVGNDADINVDGNLTINGNLTTNYPSPRDLTIGGNFTVNGVITANGSPIEVIFDGSTAQSIAGSSAVTFVDLTISNTTATVSMFNQDAVVGGILNIDPLATFSANGRQVSLAGNLVINGTIAPSGTFVFNGNTTVTSPNPNPGLANFNNVTITGILSAQGQTANIAGDFINNGTLDNLNGTIDLNGSINQTISGTSTTDFYNLSITNSSATVSNNGTVNLNTALTLGNNSTFDADGSGSGVFTIRSTSATNTARVNALPSGASVTGNVVAQRYFNLTTGAVGTGVWRNFGVAVNGATVGQITTAGFTINGNDLAREDETLGGAVNDRFELQSSFGSSIANNEGYTMFTRNAEVNTAINFTGTLNQGTQSMPITYTNSGPASDNGWNLVNNPFPSTVDWDNMNRSGSISGMVSVWNTDTDTYDTWNGTTGGLSNGLIASGQAFWIQTTGAGATLSIPESSKSTSSSTFLRSSEAPLTNHLKVSLIQENKVDKTFIHFREGATDGFDNAFDGRKLQNGIFNLASFTNSGDTLAINSLPPISTHETLVPLNITNIEEGNYTLKFENINTFVDGEGFSLFDAYLDKTVTLQEGDNYIFTVSSDKQSFGTRFTIIIESKIILGVNEKIVGDNGIAVYPNPVNHYLQIVNSAKEKINSIAIYDLNGKVVYSNTKSISYKIDMSSMKKGIYIVNIATDNKTITYRVRKK